MDGYLKDFDLHKLPELILWDLDGTLIDQTEAIICCFQKIVESFTGNQPDPAIIRRSLGGTMRQTMSLFVDTEKLEPAAKRFRALFPLIMMDGLTVLPGALASLQHFEKHECKQAILTNKHAETARQLVADLKFAPYLEHTFGSGDFEYSKPDARLTAAVLSKLEMIEANEIWMIGDSPTDVAVAKNAGLRSIAIATGAHSEDELNAAGADATFQSLIDFLNNLETTEA